MKFTLEPDWLLYPAMFIAGGLYGGFCAWLWQRTRLMVMERRYNRVYRDWLRLRWESRHRP